MLQKLFFLVSLLGLDHAGWYTNDNGYTIGLVMAAAIALVACIVFYYVWGWMRPILTNGEYILTMIVTTIITLLSVFFTARHMLLAYVADAGLTEINPSILSQIKHGTFDMWLFAINAALWCAVLFFIFSLILKRWSKLSAIPVGGKVKEIKKTR